MGVAHEAGILTSSPDGAIDHPARSPHRRRPATVLGKTRNDLADLGWIENDSDHRHPASAFETEHRVDIVHLRAQPCPGWLPPFLAKRLPPEGAAGGVRHRGGLRGVGLRRHWVHERRIRSRAAVSIACDLFQLIPELARRLENGEQDSAITPALPAFRAPRLLGRPPECMFPVD